MHLRSLHLLGVASALALVGCATPAEHEPTNIGGLKREIRTYVSSGHYDADIQKVATEATRWLEERAGRRKSGERLAVVFDLDETLFRNWPHIDEQDFAYDPAVWNRWVLSANAPVISPVRDIYRTARRLDLAVILLTSRRETYREATRTNLQRIDCGEFTALLCAPNDSRSSSAVFKSAERKRMTTEGWTIIANIGDQASDLSGGFAERTFKIPDPFYVSD